MDQISKKNSTILLPKSPANQVVFSAGAHRFSVSIFQRERTLKRERREGEREREREAEKKRFIDSFISFATGAQRITIHTLSQPALQR